MTQAPEISVIIPVYNEEESLPPLFERLFSVMEGMNQQCPHTHALRYDQRPVDGVLQQCCPRA